MLVARRGAVLLIVLGVAVTLLGMLAAATPRVIWSQRALRAVWDRVALDFAVVEVTRAATAVCAPSSGPAVRLVTTANRLTGRLEVTPITAALWRVRWGVAGAGGHWRSGEWVARIGARAAECPGGVTLRPVPGLPPGA